MHGVRAPGIVRGVHAADVVAELSRLYVSHSRDWRAMRALYHPDALILTVTGGPDPLRADDVITELERASQDVWYSVQGSQPVALDEHAAIVTGRMRRRMPQGGFQDASHVWLLTVRDGLIYRQGVYQDPEEAADAYGRLGVNLGITGGETSGAA
jgi:hypothetical protein